MYFYLVFTPFKAEQIPQDMELQEKENDERDTT